MRMLKGYAFIIAAACCWGLIGIFSKVAFNQGMGPMETAFWRAVIAWLFFAAQAFATRQTGMEKKDLPLLMAFGLLGISLFYVAYQVAVKTGGAAFASVLLYTAPAWVVACSFFIYREALSRFKILSVVLVILGVFLISRAGSGGTVSIGWVAVVSGLTSGFCYSLYYTMGKYFSRKYTSANLFLWLFPVGALGILPFVTFVHKTPVAWASLVGVSFISTFLANACYYQGLRHLEAGRASIVATLEPVVAAAMAFAFFGECFSLWGYAGAALILAAVAATIYDR